jgi:hypothetical protein
VTIAALPSKTQIFDDREILGLKGTEKIRLIIKIQSLFRGALARNKIYQRYGFQPRTMGMMPSGQGYSQPNYANPKVQEIK